MINKRVLRENISWYCLLIVPIIGTIIFNFYPLLVTTVRSFTNIKGDFIGLVNYKILFQDKVFIQSVKNTIYMAIIGVGFNVPIAFIVANMLNNIIKGKNIYKVIFLLPMVMSMVTAVTLFKYIMYPSQEGMLNYLLSFFGAGPYKFFSDVKMTRESVIAMAIWKGLGYNVILFFAGLQAVPTELYEAADIDGSGEFGKWLHITIPSMRNSFIFVVITSSISALKRFTEVYAVSGESGAPGGMLDTIMLYTYRNSFSTYAYKDEGKASTASIILFLIILLATFINMKVGKDKHENSGKIRKIRRAK